MDADHSVFRLHDLAEAPGVNSILCIDEFTNEIVFEVVVLLQDFELLVERKVLNFDLLCGINHIYLLCLTVGSAISVRRWYRLTRGSVSRGLRCVVHFRLLFAAISF